MKIRAWGKLCFNRGESKFQILSHRKQSLFSLLRKKMNEMNSTFERSISSDSHKISGIRGRYNIINTIIEEVIDQEDV